MASWPSISTPSPQAHSAQGPSHTPALCPRQTEKHALDSQEDKETWTQRDGVGGLLPRGSSHIRRRARLGTRKERQGDSGRQGAVFFIIPARASESADVQLGEEQQAVDQQPEEEDKVHHVRLLDELGERVALRTRALLQPGFSGVAGLPG